jgi:regulator of protease activity HflC (stomatin/prohibitin superfamily)
MQATSGLQFLIWLAVMIIGGGLGSLLWSLNPALGALVWFLSFVGSFMAASAVRLTTEWQRAIVLRLGKFSSQQGPGLFFVTPVLDSVPYVIDLRTNTTVFRAEQTMTRDTVPVDVDAVLFWRVYDPKRAALEVANYQQAVSWASQTALRDIIGKSTLAELLSNREAIDASLREIIDLRTEPWGTRVESVEIRDVTIPQALQDAMSRQAQAERERQARVILGDSETQIADKFAEAAKSYINNPVALHLRAMNMLYEGLREKGALVIVPSSAVESMNLGGIAGFSGLANAQQSLNQQFSEQKRGAPASEPPRAPEPPAAPQLPTPPTDAVPALGLARPAADPLAPDPVKRS